MIETICLHSESSSSSHAADAVMSVIVIDAGANVVSSSACGSKYCQHEHSHDTFANETAQLTHYCSAQQQRW
jgi:hypothetical protein